MTIARSTLKHINSRTMLTKIQRDIQTILSEYIGEKIDSTADLKASVREKILEFLNSELDNAVVRDNLKISIILSDDRASFEIKPENLLSGMWLNGFMVKPEDLSSNSLYENDVAVFQYDETGFHITPKKTDLFL